MNALLVVHRDDKRGGVVAVVENLAKHLTAAGHGVLFFHHAGWFLLKRGTTQLGFRGARLRLAMPFGPGLRGVFRTLLFPFFATTNLVQLIWLLRSERIDVVNLHYPFDNLVYFAICRRLLPIRLVTSLHGADFYRGTPVEHYSRAFKMIIRASDLVIMPSEAYRQKLLRWFPELEQRTIYIHNGINPVRFASTAEPDPPPGRRRYLLCVAELRHDKGVDVLLRAVQPVLQRYASLALVIAGDGPMRVELEDLATNLGIRRRTLFLGSQGAIEVAGLLRDCELLVVPSRMESFGIVILEAMACKRPVVASAIGGIPEIIDDGVNGILVAPEDSRALQEGVERVLADADLRTALAENGHTTLMERFCTNHNGAAYLEAFASVIGAGKAAQPPATQSAMRASSPPPSL
jgi:glycosyltransferase involved in cell wall biosynthesis